VKLYLDTSALVSLYYPEACSARVAALVAGFPLPFSALHELEAKNALMLKVFRKEAAPEAARETIEAIAVDVKSGSLIRPTVDWMEAFRAAVDLATKHSGHVGTRSLDVLHVALAQAIGSKRFASLDDRQKALAKKAGLDVVDV
jgi:predicted nucleic acid-binding protein